MIDFLKKGSTIKISLPLGADSQLALAGEELKYYLKLSLSIDASIVYDFGDILIGGPHINPHTAKYISCEEFDSLLCGPDGIFIKSYRDVLVLAGSSEKGGSGTLYAVYEFLERFLNLSLAAYGNDFSDIGEYTKADISLLVEDISYIKPKADLNYRCAIVQYANTTRSADHKLNPQFISWLGKNRYNRILTMGSIYEQYRKNGMLDEALKRGIKFTVGHHESVEMFLPPEKYYDTHPEYYRLMDDGTRYKPVGLGGQLVYCCRSKAYKAAASNILEWLDKSPGVDTIAFWPNDNIREQCKCSECQKYTKSENYVHFMNSLAREISARRKDIKLDMLVYFDLWDFPGGELHSSIIADEATWRTDGLRYVGKKDGSGLIGTKYEDTIMSWKKAGASVVYYEYYMGVFPSRQRFMPMADELQAICKRFCSLGIDGAGTQIEPFNIWNNIFNLYSYGRTAYDTDLDIEDNLERFCRIFGEAKDIVRQYFIYCENILEGQETIEKAGIYLIENSDMNYLYSLLEKALKTAQTPRARNNIRMLRMALKYSELEVKEDYSRDFIDYPNIKNVDDITGELEYMSSHYDSYTRCDPGFAIDIPIRGKSNTNFKPDYWYEFE